nr:lipoprotein [Marinobacter salexigens]
MRARILPIMMLIVAAALAGCGQKGPLYRENPEVISGVAENAADAGVQKPLSSSRDSDDQ